MTTALTIWLAIYPAISHRPPVVLERFTNATACTSFAARVQDKASDRVVCVRADDVYKP